MEIRAAIPDDADAIERIRIRGWQVAYRHIYPPDFLDGLGVESSRWRERLADPPAGWASYVAQRDGRTLGFAVVGPSRDATGCGELYALYVDPDRWSEGAGRALIVVAEGQLALEYREAELWVLAENTRARGFYERAGWRFDGTTVPFERYGFAPLAARYRKPLRSAPSPG